MNEEVLVAVAAQARYESKQAQYLSRGYTLLPWANLQEYIRQQYREEVRPVVKALTEFLDS